MSELLELDDAPSLGPLYAKAALGAVLPGGGGGELPETAVARSGVRVATPHLAEYARVCGFGLSGRLPLTYPYVLAFPLQMRLMADRSFPLALPGMVHVANRITAHRAIGSDEELDLLVRAQDLRPHPKGAQVDLVAEVRVDDALVWESRSTYLRRGAKAPESSAVDLIDPPEPDGAPVATWRVDERAGRRYAAVSGDVNPIHLHRLTAMTMGFPRAIAHGMWTAARVAAALDNRVPEAVTYDVAFRQPLLLPSTVELVTAQTPDGWSAALRSTKGKTHLTATLA